MSETTTSRTNQSATTATLAGYEIPRLGMGTMALAIEGRPSNRDARPGALPGVAPTVDKTIGTPND